MQLAHNTRWLIAFYEYCTWHVPDMPPKKINSWPIPPSGRAAVRFLSQKSLASPTQLLTPREQCINLMKYKYIYDIYIYRRPKGVRVCALACWKTLFPINAKLIKKYSAKANAGPKVKKANSSNPKTWDTQWAIFFFCSLCAFCSSFSVFSFHYISYLCAVLFFVRAPNIKVLIKNCFTV